MLNECEQIVAGRRPLPRKEPGRAENAPFWARLALVP